MTFSPDRSSQPEWAGSAQLALTIEELSVAEDELRAQNLELERTREALEIESARYRELFDHAPVPYLVTEPSGTIVDANRAASALLGYRTGSLIGKPLPVFTRAGSRRRLRTLISSVAATTEPCSASFTVVSRSRIVARVKATAAAIRNISGEITEVRWLLVDRTDVAMRAQNRRRRAAELAAAVIERTAELASAHEMKDRLLGTVSHEMRTVLAAIGGYAELLAMGIRGPMTDPQLDDVRRIQRAYDHLNKVVDDLTSFNRVASGQLNLDITTVELGDAIRNVVSLVAPEARRKSIIVIAPGIDGTPVATPVLVRADGDRVRQILVNLIGNAIKFTPAGGRIDLACSVDGPMGVVEVRDTGSGISVGSEELIFEPFIRLHRTDGVPGTGLGLSISRQFARAMEGEIIVRRTEDDGGGSCFALRLPLSTELASEQRHSGSLDGAIL